MLKISKSVVYNENQKPIAVQIPIEEFERMEELLVSALATTEMRKMG